MKVLVPIAEGSEEIEFTIIVDVLRRSGIRVTTASISKDKVLTASRGVKIEADAMFSDIQADDFDMILLPGGGPGTDAFKSCTPLLDKLKSFAQQEKWLGAICAAPTVFGKLGLLDGKKATCYPGLEKELGNCEYSADKPVVVDGHIITSRGPGTAFDFALTVIEQTVSKETAEEVKKGLLL